MKHYLDLVKISAKQHRGQNRMTRLCIAMSVFLVTAIFGMADMEIRSQMIQAVRTDGSWHAAFVLDSEQEALLRARPEVKAAAGYRSLNYHLEDGYQIEGVETGICGFDEAFQQMHPDSEVMEGLFPGTAEEAVINENIQTRLGIQIGDTIRLTLPHGGSRQLKVTGIAKNTALMAELDAFCLFLNMEGFSALHIEATEVSQEELCFVQFRRFCNIQGAIREISGQFGLSPDQVRQNAKVLMLMFQSRDSYLMMLYLVAAVLAVFFNWKCNREIHLSLRGFRPDLQLIGQIYKVGAPSIVVQAIGSVMTYGMNLILAAFGAAQTVFGVYFKLQSFIFMPIFGLNNGMVPIIAYNYGAGHRERVIRTMKSSILFAVCIMLAGLLAMELFPAQLLGFFNATQELLDIGVPALRTICLSFCFAGYCIVVGSVFQALGNGVYSMVVSIARQLCVLLPVAYLLSLSGNVDLIWWAFPIAEFMSLGMSTYFLMKINRDIIRHIGETPGRPA